MALHLSEAVVLKSIYVALRKRIPRQLKDFAISRSYQKCSRHQFLSPRVIASTWLDHCPCDELWERNPLILIGYFIRDTNHMGS
jgi:hypothetical protein